MTRRTLLKRLRRADPLLEARLTRAVADLAQPELVERAASVRLRDPEAAVRKRGRPRLLVWALVACLVAGGAAVASTTLVSPSIEKTTADRASNAAALLGSGSETNSVASLTDLADDRRIARRIQEAPWSDPDGARDLALSRAPRLGALRFPAGVSYAKAITVLYMAMIANQAPAGATLVNPLPDGKVALVPEPELGSVVLDLRAPFGYQPGAGGGRILLPSVGSAPNETASGDRAFEDRSWTIGGRVVPAILPPCMRMDDPNDTSPAQCSPADIPLQDLNLLAGPRLP